jgi:hypothetical protein
MSGKGKKGGKGGKGGSSSSSSSSRGVIEIDPEQVYFTHSRVRPFFTGCNKRIEDTLEEIVSGTTKVTDIPLITIIPNEGHYFSLNNRRLFLFKTLRSRGLLPGNVIQAYVKAPLEREKQRYLPSRCALVAKMMKEKEKGSEEVGDGDEEQEEPECTDE